MNNKVSIIVPCYNSENTIARCANSILKAVDTIKSSDNFEFIIVNDGSEDKTLEIINNLKNVKIINHDRNLGLSIARNSGIKKSTSDYIIFIDSDVIISKNWIKDMCFFIKNNKNIVGITGNLKADPNKEASSLDKYLFSKYRGTKKIDINTPLNYRSFVFSNTIIKRSILDQVGMFDESITNYGGEDTELAIRLHKKYPKGMRKLTGINAYHITEKTVEQHIENMFEYGKYNFFKIITKHPDYKNDLGYQWTKSIKGRVLFNPFNQLICKFLLKFLNHPLLIKFLVIDAFIRGVKNKS